MHCVGWFPVGFVEDGLKKGGEVAELGRTMRSRSCSAAVVHYMFDGNAMLLHMAFGFS